MPKSTLDDNGEFWVKGTKVKETAKRIIVQCDTRGSEYLAFHPKNVKEV